MLFKYLEPLFESAIILSITAITLHHAVTNNMRDNFSQNDVLPSVREYAIKLHYKDPLITVNTNDGKYASGMISDQAAHGGARWVATQINSEWVVVHMGNGLSRCEDIAKYRLPEKVLRCY